LSLNDRAGVLRRLQDALAGGTGAQLTADVVAAVKASAIRFRGDANARGNASSSESYLRAEEQLRQANRLESREPLKAVAAFWDAGDLFQQAVNDIRADPAVPVTAPPREVAQNPAAVPQPQPAPAPGPTTVLPTGPIAATGSDSSAPAVTPPATAAARPPAAPPPQPPTDEDLVRNVIDRYRQANAAKDPALVLQVYPSLMGTPAEQRLRDTFKIAETYNVEVQVLDVQVRGEEARATARLVRRIAMRGRRPETYDGPAEFRLQRKAGTWVIVSVAANER
jgi:hypothetical protein